MIHLIPPDTFVPAMLASLCAFLLRTSAAFLLCWALVYLATSARLRFTLWLGYLVAAAGYWVWTLQACVALALLPGGRVGSIAETSNAAHPANATHPVVLSFAQSHTTARALSVALLLYAATLLWLLLRGASQRITLGRALRGRSAVSPEILTIAEAVAAEAAAPACDVYLLPALTSAASAGILRPAIYLPADALSGPDLRDILRHELTHIARRDALWDSIGRICHALLIFSPFAAFAVRALRLEREIACDEQVVRSAPHRRDAYAEMLVRIGWRLATADEARLFDIRFAAQSSPLKARVCRILEGERVYSPWARGTRGLLAGAGVLAVIAALPLLSVAFALPLLPVRQVPTPPAHIVTRAHRTARSISRESHVAPTAVPAPRQIATLPATTTPTPASPAPRYRLYPSPGAPMSDDSALTADPDQGLSGRIGSTASRAPSVAAAVRDTAIELGRLGLSHDHDHDMH